MSNTFKHSHGPWHYEESSNCDSVFTVTDDDRTQIAEVERWNSDDEADVMEQAEANARLIRAAPDLLAFAILWKTGRGTPKMMVDMMNDILAKICGE